MVDLRSLDLCWINFIAQGPPVLLCLACLPADPVVMVHFPINVDLKYSPCHTTQPSLNWVPGNVLGSKVGAVANMHECQHGSFVLKSPHSGILFSCPQPD